MPTYKFLLVETPERKDGLIVEWDLPFERLVFDQRFDHQKEGADVTGRYRILNSQVEADGMLYTICIDEGCRQGGDPKKARP